MKLLGLCVATLLVAGVSAAPHLARAQALGEAAALNAGASTAGTGAGSALGRNIGRAMGSEGRRVRSSGKTSTSSGVMNLHWSESQRTAARTHARGKPAASKTKAAAKSGKAQPEFVIFGADAQKADSVGAAVSQPKPDATAKKDAGSSSGPGGKP
jgi:hypothetical protein